MFKHILVPTDLTRQSVRALEMASRLASPGVSRITFLHVIETLDDADYTEFEEFYETLRNRAQKKLDELAGEHESEKLAIDKRIVYGKRVGEILRFEEEHEIDLIVLSSHKIDKTRPSEGWGTISHQVGILSHCPVMMVK